MAENKVVKITFEVDGIQQSVGSVEELQAALKGVDKQATQTASKVEGVAKAADDMGQAAVSAGEAGQGAIDVLDEATGGLANQFVQVGKGITDMGKYFIQSFKAGVQGASAMGKALIATGIGAVNFLLILKPLLLQTRPILMLHLVVKKALRHKG